MKREQRLRRFICDYKETDCKVFENFAKHILSQIEAALAERQITVAYTSARAKTPESLERKCQKEVQNENGETKYKYSDFKNDITDQAGVRIVTYLLDDVKEVSKIVEELFDVTTEQSEDKLELLGANKVGYLSVHYIVALKEEKLNAGEASYRNLKCEVQIRTLLEDAWAQIFHDRQYKSELKHLDSEKLTRRTNLLSGSLELLDHQISEVVTEYDQLSGANMVRKLRVLLEKPISRDNFALYINCKFGGNSRFHDYQRIEKILQIFKLKTIGDFDALVKQSHCEDKIKTQCNFLTADKIISYVLIICDTNKFFKTVGNNVVISKDSYDFLSEFVDIGKFWAKFSSEIEIGGKDVNG